MNIKCIIVDDEPLAQKVLEKYIAALSSLELVKKCNNALEAMSFLHQHPVDLLFLDIKMPGLSGLDFLKTLSNPPSIILTTAFSEYALEGYEYSVVDYLLKPFSFERFLKAVNKALEKQKIRDNSFFAPVEEIKNDFLFLKADKVNHKVSYSEIKYIEGYGNYIKIFTKSRTLLVSETMNNIEKKLPRELFLRIHRSYIVSIKKINQIEGNMISIDDKRIPVGNYYKMQVYQVFEKYNLQQDKKSFK